MMNSLRNFLVLVGIVLFFSNTVLASRQTDILQFSIATQNVLHPDNYSGRMKRRGFSNRDRKLAFQRYIRASRTNCLCFQDLDADWLNGLGRIDFNVVSNGAVHIFYNRRFYKLLKKESGWVGSTKNMFNRYIIVALENVYSKKRVLVLTTKLNEVAPRDNIVEQIQFLQHVVDSIDEEVPCDFQVFCGDFGFDIFGKGREIEKNRQMLDDNFRENSWKEVGDFSGGTHYSVRGPQDQGARLDYIFYRHSRKITLTCGNNIYPNDVMHLLPQTNQAVCKVLRGSLFYSDRANVQSLMTLSAERKGAKNTRSPNKPHRPVLRIKRRDSNVVERPALLPMSPEEAEMLGGWTWETPLEDLMKKVNADLMNLRLNQYSSDIIE